MTDCLNNLILAESDGIGALLPFLVFIAIAVISGIAKSAKAKKEKQAQVQGLSAPEDQQRAKRLAAAELEFMNAKPAKAKAGWVDVSIPEIVPVGVIRSEAQTDRFGTQRNEPCDHPAPQRGGSHVHREVANTPALVSEKAEQFTVNLSSREKLAQAMVMHELLAPPLAMREQGNMWDD